MIDSFSGIYGFLSNFYPTTVIFDGQMYPTVEHAFQAAKTLDVKQREHVQVAHTPGEAKRRGRRVTLREDWEKIKVEVMEELVTQKFTHHNALREKSIATEDAEIVEGNTWGDTFWGQVNGEGQNHLGKILMRVRNTLREKADA